MKDLTDILHKAIAMEQEGEKFYRHEAERAKNPLARTTFTALAREERRHAEMLRGYCDAVVESGACPVPPVADSAREIVASLAAGVMDSARELLGGEPLEQEDLHEVYEKALLMEQQKLEAYSEWAESIEEPHAAELFTYLIGQERGHLTLLQEGQKYLDDPDSWHFEQERWSVEG